MTDEEAAFDDVERFRDDLDAINFDNTAYSLGPRLLLLSSCGTYTPCTGR